MFKMIIMMFFFFLLLVALLGFSIFRTVLRFLFGDAKSSSKRPASRRNSSKTGAAYRKQAVPKSEKKIFSKDEGDYVDYEEVKD